MSTFYQNDLAIKNTADVTGGKPIAICSQSISSGAVNQLVAFYDIHGRNGEEYSFVSSRAPHETSYLFKMR
jgi:hypothetical protein